MRVASFFLAGLILGLPLWADHVPEKSQATGHPDSVLCGFDIYQVRRESLFARLGNPDKVEEHKAGPSDAPDIVYSWRKGDLEFSAAFFDKNPESTPFTLMVRGSSRSGDWGQTGRGLGLGDPFTAVGRIYGHSWSTRSGTRVLVQWDDETTIELHFSADKLESIKLLSAE